ncbi:MAG: glycosyltransferase family 39 protein [Lysobacterales bacterium]
MPETHPLYRRGIALTLLLALVLALSFQGGRGLWGPDEGRYSNIALQMVDSGDWLTPRRHPAYEHWAKPPLTYWAIAASVQTFGRSEAALRLPNALSYVATAFLLVLLGLRLLPAAPWLPALIFVTSPVPFGAGNWINTDYLLTAFETLAMLGYVHLLQATDARAAGRARALLWTGLGLAFMTKGPPGLLPLLPMLVYARLQPAPRPRVFSLTALLLFLAIALPWYALVIYKHEGLLGYFLGYEVYGRVFTDIHDRNSGWTGPIEVYGPTLLIGLLPWSLLLMRRLPALLRVRGWPAWWRTRTREDQLLILWFLLPFLVFCFARSRLYLYLLPLLVPLAILIGRRLHPFNRHRLRQITWTALISAAVLLAGKALGPDWAPHAKDARELAGTIDAHWTQRPREIVFVEESAFYGLYFYLGAPVTRVSLAARDDPAYDAPLARVVDSDATRVWVTTANRIERLQAALAPQGLRFEQRASLERYVFGSVVAAPAGS